MRSKLLLTMLLTGLLLGGCGAPMPTSSPAVVEPAHTLPAPTPVQPSFTAEPTQPPPLTATEVITAPPDLPPQTNAPAPLSPTGASPAFLSSRGQLAFLQDGVLMVESAPQSGQFTEIARYTSYARWSPDGARLLFDLNPAAINYTGEAGIYLLDYRIWNADDDQVVSLPEALVDFPHPPYLAGSWIPLYLPVPAAFQNTWVPGELAQGQTVWSPDSTKIFFINIVEPDRLPVSFPGSNSVLVADLEAGQSWLAAEAVLISRVLPVSADAFIVQDHCGELCEWLTAYDLRGGELWHLPWVTDGSYAIASDRAYLISSGRITYDQPTETNTVDQIETASGSYQPVWQLTPEEYFVPSYLYQTALSDDDSLVSFNLFRNDQLNLLVTDLHGKSYGQIPDAINLGWQPGNGLMALQLVRSASPGEVQLVYWYPPTGSPTTVFGPTRFVPTDGAWSPDGSSYAFCAYDPASASQSLYLWSTANPAVLEIQNSPTGQAVHCNTTWRADSSVVYFNLMDGSAGTLQSSLWQYTLASGQADKISGTP